MLCFFPGKVLCFISFTRHSVQLQICSGTKRSVTRTYTSACCPFQKGLTEVKYGFTGLPMDKSHIITTKNLIFPISRQIVTHKSSIRKCLGSQCLCVILQSSDSSRTSRCSELAFPCARGPIPLCITDNGQEFLKTPLQRFTRVRHYVSRGLKTTVVSFSSESNSGEFKQSANGKGGEEQSLAVRSIKTVTSLGMKTELSLEQFYQRDNVNSDALLIYKHEALGRYGMFYAFTTLLYTSNMLAFYILKPPAGMSLIRYTVETVGEHGLFYEPFTCCLVLLPISMHLWTFAFQMVRRQFRSIYFHPNLNVYTGISYSWRWQTRRITFTQEDVDQDTGWKHRITVQDQPYILHPDCFTSEIYKERLFAEKDQLEK